MMVAPRDACTGRRPLDAGDGPLLASGARARWSGALRFGHGAPSVSTGCLEACRLTDRPWLPMLRLVWIPRLPKPRARRMRLQDRLRAHRAHRRPPTHIARKPALSEWERRDRLMQSWPPHASLARRGYDMARLEAGSSARGRTPKEDAQASRRQGEQHMLRRGAEAEKGRRRR